MNHYIDSIAYKSFGVGSTKGFFIVWNVTQSCKYIIARLKKLYNFIYLFGVDMCTIALT